MKGILADADITGQVRVVMEIVLGASWREYWDYLELQVFSFDQLGLTRRSLDSVVWRTCQERGLVLITGNRNKRGPNSLQATLLRENDATKLPVLTLADARRVSSSKPYANLVAEKLIEYLLEIDKYRGAGRLFIP